MSVMFNLRMYCENVQIPFLSEHKKSFPNTKNLSRNVVCPNATVG